MPKKEVIQVNLAAANPNLSPATRFGRSGVRRRANRAAPDHRGGRQGRWRGRTRYAIERIEMILASRGDFAR